MASRPGQPTSRFPVPVLERPDGAQRRLPVGATSDDCKVTTGVLHHRILYPAHPRIHVRHVLPLWRAVELFLARVVVRDTFQGQTQGDDRGDDLRHVLQPDCFSYQQYYSGGVECESAV
jgi:hypothetical protein